MCSEFQLNTTYGSQEIDTQDQALFGPFFSQCRANFQWLAVGFEAVRSEIIQLSSRNMVSDHFEERGFQISHQIWWKLKWKIIFLNLSENLKFLLTYLGCLQEFCQKLKKNVSPAPILWLGLFNFMKIVFLLGST